MTFNEVLAEVLAITARPDRTAEAQNAINWAISHIVLKGEFAFDLVEASIPINGTSYGETIQFNNVSPNPLVSRFRKFKYIKPGGALGYLTPIGCDQVFQPAHSMQKNVYYVAGNNLTYILSALATSLEIGYYQYAPRVNGSSVPSHWTIEMIPQTVIDLSAARIFRSIGDDESHRIYQGMGEDLLREARRDFSDGVRPMAR